VLNGLHVSVYNCPSNSYDPFEDNDRGASGTSPTQAMKHDYSGIAGATPDPAGRTTGTCVSITRGCICRNGILVMNEQKGIHQVTDGTSQTILVAEQSGAVTVTENGQSVKYPIRTNYAGGWAGPGDANTVSQLTSISTSYNTGLTTVMWAPNTPTATANFSDYTYMANTILNSFHPGVVQVAMADGSSRAFSDTIDMETLRRLCVADDGQAIGQY
jgi:hypothetical protein